MAELTVPFQLLQIRVPQFAILADWDSANPTLHIHNEFGFGATAARNQVVVQHTFIYTQGDQPLVKLITVCAFGIEPSAWQKLEESGHLHLPAQFAAHLAAVAVSTARGIFHAKSESTVWASKPMPLMNVGEYFNEEVRLGLE